MSGDFFTEDDAVSLTRADEYARWLRDPVKCRNCGEPIERWSDSSFRSSTGWSHRNPATEHGDWEGIRCPGRLTGAGPDPDLGE